MSLRVSSVLLLCLFAHPLFATKSVSVKPSIRKNGTYVSPHRRTAPNTTRMDNWSSKGNVNPYTGKAGKVDPFKPKKKPYR